MNTSPKAVNSGQTEREAYRDAVTRKQIEAWAKLAGIEHFTEKGLERLGDFAIFARQARAASTATAMLDILHDSNRENDRAWSAENRVARAAAPQGLTDALHAMVKKWERWQADGERRGCPQTNGMGTAITDLRAILADQSPAPASPSGEDAAEQSAAPMADPLRAAVESMVCMLENGEWAEHASTYKAPGDKLAARLEAAITDLHNELSGDSEQADEAVTELQNIVNAKRFDRDTFANDTEFADWVQSRARHTLGRAKEPK